jgi:hypothetical protein
MAIFELSARRLILAGGFALAVATAPAIAVFTVPSGSVPLACPSGEEEDLYTGECLPHTVPNSPLNTSPGSLPSVNLPGGGGSIPCTGGNSGQCIGLSEEAEAAGPAAVPHSSVSSSP